MAVLLALHKTIKKTGNHTVPGSKSLLCSGNDFLFVVRTTSLADPVRYHKLTAAAAFYQTRHAHFPVRPAAVTPRL
jgi:hypothetical protein